jgi:hypothetical protein
MNVFSAALGAFDFIFFVFMKREDEFERFLAVFAVKLIARHKNLLKALARRYFYLTVYAREVLVSRMVGIGTHGKDFKRAGFAAWSETPIQWGNTYETRSCLTSCARVRGIRVAAMVCT